MAVIAEGANGEVTQAEASNPVSAARWKAEIALYDQQAQTWTERGKKIIKRYRDERSPREASVSRFNILWSNVQTLKPALYARNPKPDISRRFNANDPVGRMAAQVLERATSYFVSQDAFGQSMSESVTDYLLPGRGVSWARYVPHFRDSAVEGSEEVKDDGAQVTDDADSDDAEAAQEITFEEVVFDYVHWQDFGHTVGRTWEEVDAVWRRVFLAKEELEERFGKETADKIPLDHKAEGPNGEKRDEVQAKATIYEIWDKGAKNVIWLHKDVDQPLDIRSDPLRLSNFFPCPRPLFANLCNESCIPTPDFSQYQDQAHQLDEITSRIASITKALKLAGVYDASAQGVERLLSEGVENQLIPVEEWAVFAEKGGLKGAIDFLPLEATAKALLSLHEAREKVKAELYEVTGIADIIRGNSDPRETATAQQLKGNFATLRLMERQTEVQRFARDNVRIAAEIIANHFQPETIKMVSGVQLFSQQEKQAMQTPNPMTGQPMMPPPPYLRPDELQEMMEEPDWESVIALIRDEPARKFRIDIETDSTIKQDQEQEKANRLEFLKAVGGFLQNAVPAAENNPAMLPVLGQMLMFGVRAFPVGKELEGVFNNYLDKAEKQASQPQGPTKEDKAAQAEMAKEQAKGQIQMQVEQAKGQIDLQREQMRIEADKQIAIAEAQAKAAADAAKAKQDALVEQHKQAVQQQQIVAQQAAEIEKAKAVSQIEGELEWAKARLDAETKILVATIQANAAAQKSAADAEAKAADDAKAEAKEAAKPQGPDMGGVLADAINGFRASIEGLGAGLQELRKPRQVVRDKDGNIQGIS